MPDAERFDDFRHELDEEFDQALAEVNAALASVPLAIAVPLPGFEVATENSPETQPESAAPPSPVHPKHPLQGRLDLGSFCASESDNDDDPIAAFAPDPAIDWGPHRPMLTHRGDTPE